MSVEDSVAQLIGRSEVIANWSQEDLESFVALLGQDVPSTRSQCSEGRREILAEQKRKREALIKQQKSDMDQFDARCKLELASQELKQEAKDRPLTRAQVKAASIVDGCPVPSLLLDKDIRIIHVNDHWLAACQCSRQEILGSTLGFLQGPLTSKHELQRFNETCAKRLPASVRLVNYRSDRMPVWNTIQAVPVDGGGFITTHHIVPCNPTEFYPTSMICNLVHVNKKTDMLQVQRVQEAAVTAVTAAVTAPVMLAASQQVAAILQGASNGFQVYDGASASGTILNPLKRENTAANLDALHAWSKKQKCSADPATGTG